MCDRMIDLKKLCAKLGTGPPGSVLDPPEGAEGEDDPDLEMPKVPERENKFPEESPLNDFFDAVAAVGKFCIQIEAIVPKYSEAAHELTAAVDCVQAKEGQAKVDRIVKVGKKIIKQNKKMIDQMDSEMKKQMRLDVDEEIASGAIEKKDAPNAEEGETLEQWGATYRVMNNCRWALVAKWKRVNKVYNEEQAACDRRKRENLIRQLTIANGCEPTDDEVTARLNSGATDVFSGGMVARAADADADYANEFLNEAKEEMERMQEIQKRMQEMNEMWDEFQLLLQKQNELLSTISGNLQKSKEFIKQANEDLDAAQEHAEAANRQQVMILCSCCIGLCVLIVPMMIGSGMISV